MIGLESSSVPRRRVEPSDGERMVMLLEIPSAFLSSDDVRSRTVLLLLLVLLLLMLLLLLSSISPTTVSEGRSERSSQD